ncbi:MAG: diguanylate cyclase [Tardiphaga sp.]|nr:diguanylate cyclase [Tardiphaga sp.]
MSTSTAIIVAIVVIIVLCRRQFLGRMRTQNIQLAAALNNIAQGLIMLDARARLVICNRRYAEMYRLPAELSRPGTPLSAILEWRKFDGTFFGEPQDEVTRLIERSGIQIESKDMQTEDGRAISIVSASMEDGGWVATHEDITERVKKEASFRLLFESNPVPMWVYDQGTLGFIAVNQAAIARYGYSKERFVSLTVADIRPTEAPERFLTWLTDPAPNDPDNDTWQHVTAAGEVMDVSIYSQALEYEGRNARLVAIHDVTEQRRATAELAKTKMFLDAVIENVPVPIVVKDVPAGATSADNCRLSLLNRAAEDLYGRTRSACIGRTLAEIFPEASGQAAIRLDADALASDGAIVSEDHMTFSPSKGLRLVTSKRLALRSTLGEPEHLLALFEDVTDRRENEKRIAYMAHHDILTGLANRAAFDQCFAATLEQAQGKGSQVSLMCIDLDGFKEINDTYGHSAGDAVLREVAKRLNLGGEGAFIARFGGDEFALIVADDRKGTSSDFVAGQILNMMRAEIRVGEHRLKVGATIGIAQYPVHGTDCESLLCNADIALYRAKAAEPGTVQFFTPQMGAQVRDRRNLQDDLGRAIAAGEISLHYQPQCLSDGSVIGFEALARWNSPKRGMVSPAQFIEIAEESGLIQPLGEWVLREACREAAGWPQPFKISVNVSPKQFRDGDLPNLVQWILLETGLTPGRLELEITEGVLIGDFSRAVSVLNRLKALGVDIALDDFGTGYSSLSYLHSFPFDLIKIDRTFVSDVRTNRHSSAIVRAVIGLGRSLGVPILAEGVETEEQRAFLFEEGCHAVQGYLTGRPAPAEAYPQLLRVGGESPGRARLRVGRA